MCTLTTISRLLPINIIKLTNIWDFNIINYKVHGCILHASTYPSLTYAISSSSIKVIKIMDFEVYYINNRYKVQDMIVVAH
jgi:hypothetical protein